MIAAVRLAFGLLTIFPVGSPRQLDRRTAGRAVAFFPLVGLVLGILAAILVKLVRAWFQTFSLQLLPAVLALALLAFLTRGMHLDGLADVADGLGASRDAKRSLEVMKQSTVGAFGVITLVLVVLVQAAALERCIVFHRGTLAVVLAVTVGRLSMMLACRRGIPAARPDGLGALVAGSIRARWVALVVCLTAAAGALGGKFDIDGGRNPAGPARRARVDRRAGRHGVPALAVVPSARRHHRRRAGWPERDRYLRWCCSYSQGTCRGRSTFSECPQELHDHVDDLFGGSFVDVDRQVAEYPRMWDTAPAPFVERPRAAVTAAMADRHRWGPGWPASPAAPATRRPWRQRSTTGPGPPDPERPRPQPRQRRVPSARARR